MGNCCEKKPIRSDPLIESYSQSHHEQNAAPAITPSKKVNQTQIMTSRFLEDGNTSFKKKDYLVALKYYIQAEVIGLIIYSEFRWH